MDNEKFLKEINKIIDENGQVSYFNLIAYWGHNLEVPHSRVLSALLDPKDIWYCVKGKYSYLFLERFIEMLELGIEYDPKKVKIIKESPTKSNSPDEESGRVDIEIKLDDDTSILIENKINAKLEFGQLAKYKKQHKSKNTHIVYLSLEGDDPTPESLKFGTTRLKEEEVKCISYGNIAEWLRECLYEIKEDNSLKRGVEMYLDTIYNIIEDERNQYPVWKQTYKKLFEYVDSKKISKELLEGIKEYDKEHNENNDEENNESYIGDIIDKMDRREDIINIYNKLSQKFPEKQFYISYEDIGEKQHNIHITDLNTNITDLLCGGTTWIGFSVCVYEGESDKLYHYVLFDDTPEMKCGLSYQGSNDVAFEYEEFLEKNEVEYDEFDSGWVDNTDKNKDNFCEVSKKLTESFKSFNTCREYLSCANGADVYEGVVQFLKEKEIEYTLKYQDDKIALSLYNHDWWLTFNCSFGEFALGYGAGYMWIYCDDMAQKDKLEEFGFKLSGNDGYGEEYLEYVFEDYFEDDKVAEDKINELTEVIKNKISKIL